MPNGLRVAEQAYESLCEIGVVRDHPERRAVSRHNHLLSADHPVDRGIRLLPAIEYERNQSLAIGQRWPHYGYGKTLVAIGPQQTLFTGDLVPRIVPMRIRERSRFGHQVVRLRFLIGAGGTDEHELAGGVPGRHVEWGDVGRGGADDIEGRDEVLGIY